jgi:hypothetical protein
VEARQDPWPPRVEAQALHPVALRLELGQHPPGLASPATAAGEAQRPSSPWPRRGAARRWWSGGSGGEREEGGGGVCTGRGKMGI